MGDNLHPIKHGTRHAYSRRGCRCDECTRANTEHSNIVNAKRRALAKTDPLLVPHGTTSGYRRWGCRCELCTKANTVAVKRWRESTL